MRQAAPLFPRGSVPLFIDLLVSFLGKPTEVSSFFEQFSRIQNLLMFLYDDRTDPIRNIVTYHTQLFVLHIWQLSCTVLYYFMFLSNTYGFEYRLVLACGWQNKRVWHIPIWQKLFNYLIYMSQVEEETGIHLNVHDMVDLTAFLDSSTGARVFPSPVSFLRLL